MSSSRLAVRAATGATLVAAVTAVVLLLLTGGRSYVVHARFADAGQLVSGDYVEVGGLPVGTIGSITVADDGQADIALRITDGRFVPLHRGTLASIRAPGLAGVANRYIALTPAPSSEPPIPAGSVLPPTATRGIVDLDQLLDSLDKPTRDRLVSIIDNGASGFGAPLAANSAFHVLNPALSQTALLSAELTRDQTSLTDAVASTATVFHALDSRRTDISQGVAHLSVALRAIASQRSALGDMLGRATSVITRIRFTLSGVRQTLPVLGATLVQARPVTGPLTLLLGRIVPDAGAIEPALGALRGQLPALRRTLDGVPRLASAAIPALRATISAIAGAIPIFGGLRPYSEDLMGDIAMFAQWFGDYDNQGHYGRLTPITNLKSFAGIASLIGDLSVPGLPLFSSRTGVLARCPGGAAEPALDRSNPWVPSPPSCSPKDNQP